MKIVTKVAVATIPAKQTTEMSSDVFGSSPETDGRQRCTDRVFQDQRNRKPVSRVKFAYEGRWIKVKDTKAPNFLFPLCKTLAGNKSGSVEDRAVKFACSMGFCL